MAGPEALDPAPPAEPGSYEWAFYQIAWEQKAGALLLLLHEGLAALSQPHPHRLFAVVHDPLNEIHTPIRLALRYDEFLFVDRTSAIDG